MTPAQFWQNYCATDPKINRRAAYAVWQFGEQQDELAAMVARGKKTGTTSAYTAYMHENSPLPTVMGYNIILDSHNEPIAITQTTQVSVLPFADATPAMAVAEGEKDCSLDTWRQIHTRFFGTELANWQETFTEQSLVVFEWFTCVYSVFKLHRTELINRLVTATLHDKSHPDVQQIQSAYRLQLCDTWNIQPGNRLLEIGAGQGDMTGALAAVVGPQGEIVAIDAAPDDYGAPYSLKAANDHLLKSEFGQQITFHRHADLMAEQWQFDDQAFDAVVIAHASWYFSSPETFQQLLKRVYPWSKRLLIADWDLRLTAANQFSHWLAVLIQSQSNVLNLPTQGNIVTAMTESQTEHLAQLAGWQLAGQTILSVPQLQDGRWEAQSVTAETPAVNNLPAAWHTQLQAERQLLQATAWQKAASLNSFALSFTH